MRLLLLLHGLVTLTLGRSLKAPPPLHHQASIRDDIFIVEFDEALDNLSCRKMHDTFRKTIQQKPITWLERRSFCTLFNGISFHIKSDSIPELINIPNVKAIWPMIAKRLPHYSLGTGESTSDPRENHIMTGVTQVQEELRLDGTGIKVGVIDTGIDYTHPYLGGCYKKPGCRVMFGKDLVGDKYDGELNMASPDDDPRDICGGHGTHVAGIIGANGPEFKGVAPNVTLGAYRVFGCGPDARVESDIIIEAMELAYRDGMNIINLSLGGGSAWSEYPDSVVADTLSRKGVLVIAASGNDGDKGMWEVSSPAIGGSVISTTSFDSEKFMARAFTINSLPDSRIDYTIGPNTLRFNVTNVTAIQASGINMEGCNATDSIKGKVLVVKRGTCSFDIKAKLAATNGAIGLIVINTNPGTFTPLLTKSNKISIPVVGLSSQMGNLLLTNINKSPNKEVVITTPPSFVNPNGGRISTFSSWGPGPELEIKPDLGAPGGMIFSTFPVPLGMFATLSGTSMATPYTAGVAALYMQANPNHTPDQVRQALQNSCQPAMERNSSLPTTVARQGAGMLNAYVSINSNSRITPSRLVLNDTYTSLRDNHSNISKSFVAWFDVTNSGSELLTYEVSHQPSSSVSSYKGEGLVPIPRRNELALAKVSFDRSLFKVQPNSTHRVKVQILAPDSLPPDEYWFFSGFLRLSSSQSNMPPLHLPYLGVMGNYAELPILANEVQAFPRLKRNRDNQLFNTTSMFPTSYTFEGKDTLTLQVRIEHPTKMLTVSAINADTGDELGYIVGGINFYVSRNDHRTANRYYKFPWAGACLLPKPTQNNVTSKLGLPVKFGYKPFMLVEGKFKLKVSALKPFGNPHIPHHFQSWVSPLIVLSRTNLSNAKQVINWDTLSVPLITNPPHLF